MILYKKSRLLIVMTIRGRIATGWSALGFSFSRLVLLRRIHRAKDAAAKLWVYNFSIVSLIGSQSVWTCVVSSFGTVR